MRRHRITSLAPRAFPQADSFRWALMIGILVVCCACGSQEDQRSDRAESTVQMAERLQQLAEGGDDPTANAFTPEKMVEVFEQIETPPDIRSRVSLDTRKARALLFAGRTEEAVEDLRRLRQMVAENPRLFKKSFQRNLLSLSAIAALRLGEQQNCLQNHTVASCLMPIEGDGVHRLPAGAEEAVDLYEQLLSQKPEDLSARWLLNISAMAAGQYPQGVPDEWLIEPEIFTSEAEVERFWDVAPDLGVAVVGLSGGVVLEDLDGDHLLDLMVSSWGLLDPLRFFRNNGDGTFTDRTDAAGLQGLGGGLNLVHGDYDNNGFADVLVLRGAWQGKNGRHPNSLLRNRGDGTFEDVTEAAGLLDFYPTQTAAWGDYNNDGLLDLYVGNESTGRQTYPCQLFRNRGDGTFEDVAPAAQVATRGFVKGVVWGDYNRDGFLDLYVSRLLEPNLLFRNAGPGEDGEFVFQEVAQQAGVEEPLHSFPVWFWDYNNDGWLDLFVSGYPVDIFTAHAAGVAADYLGLPTDDERPRLYRNQGDGTFKDVTHEAGLYRVLHTMGSGFGDLDNDGFLDTYLGTGAPDFRSLMPNRMFLNTAGDSTGRVFRDVTTSGGFGHLQKGHGVAFGDLDNDGDQDIYAVMGGAYSGDVYQNLLFENPGTDHRWLTVLLEGVESNRSAIGAHLRLSLEGADGPREIYVTVGSGGSFGASSLRQEIGLGRATAVRRLEVFWPSGGQQLFENVVMDQAMLIREGADQPEILQLPKLDLGQGQAANGHRH